MKVRVLLVLALTLTTVPALLASDANMKKGITLGTVAMVGNTTLQPGDYKVEWQGTGSNVKVDIMQGKRVVASAPATVENKHSANNAILMKNAGNGAESITEIDFHDMALVFAPNQGNNTTQPTSSSR
jgi:hypothetical protein